MQISNRKFLFTNLRSKSVVLLLFKTLNLSLTQSYLSVVLAYFTALNG